MNEIKNKAEIKLYRKWMVFHIALVFFAGSNYGMCISDANASANVIVSLTILYIISVITNIGAVMCISYLMCREKEQDEIEEN
ncbi:MAG: hypothetical protein J6J16_07125 [Lachnospiraceae bacterium]|nr:hypothetical protein [Lachnospiraceae bacterium]